MGGAGRLLRLAAEEDAEAPSRVYVRSREHLRRRQPPQGEEFYTSDGQASHLREQLGAYRNGQMVPRVLTQHDEIVGTVTLSNVGLGPFRSASLGYRVDAEYTGRGIATAAVAHTCRVADEEVDLHRIEASAPRPGQASRNCCPAARSTSCRTARSAAAARMRTARCDGRGPGVSPPRSRPPR